MNTLMTIIDNFRTFLATEKSDSSSLVFDTDVRFKLQTDLRRIADVISGNIATEQINTIDSLMDVSKEMADFISNEDSKSIVDLIDSVGLGLAQQLVSSITELKAIKSEVSTLEQVIHERYVNYIKQEGAEELLGNKPSADHFTIFNWDRINSSNSVNRIIDSLHQYAGLRQNTMTNSNLNYIVVKLSENLKRFNSLNIDDTMLENLDAFCVNALKNYDTLTPEDINKFTLACVDKRSMLQLWVEIRELMKNRQSTPLLLIISNKMQDYVNIKTADIDIFNTENITAFYQNVDLLNIIQQIAKYHCALLKNTIYKDKIVINNVYINGPEFSKIEKQGKTLEDIALFVKVVYPKLPVNGISTQIFMTKNIDYYLESYRQNLQLQEQNIKYKCLNRAYVNALRQYYDNIAALMGLDTNDDQYKTTKANWYTHVMKCSGKLIGDISKLDYALYDTLISFLYGGTITEQLYRRLNKTYEQLIDTSEESIEDDQILIMELRVIVDIIIEYLLNNYCDVSLANKRINLRVGR